MRTAFHNGRIYGPVAADATAIGVDGGTVVWIGDDSAAREWAADRRVDLDGAWVAPAFVDAHFHATDTGLANMGLDLRATRSSEEVVAAVAAAARASRGRPILGGGWDESSWSQDRVPSIAELDRASYGGVVYLTRIDKHSALASSALLAAVPGIASLGGFDRTGWLRGPAHDAVRSAALSAITPAQRREAQRAALRRAAELGIACVHEMGGPVLSSADDLADLLALSRAEPVPQVVGYWGELLAIETAVALGAAGAAGDVFCDGSLGSHTAALHTPYADRPDSSGELRFATGDLAEHIARCIDAGLQAGFHAIGEAAVDQVLDAVDIVTKRLGRPAGVSHRIEHAEMVRDPQRLAASGLVASMQPCFDAVWGGPDGMYAQRLGADRARGLNRFADLVAAGVPLAFGSDSPVTETGPWAAVRAAVHPHDRTAALPASVAFDAHTAGGARAAGLDGRRLEPGAAATFSVWRTEAAELLAIEAAGELPTCLATVRDGVPIHDSGLLAGFSGVRRG